MSYLIVDISAEYTDRTTGNRQIRCEIIADSVSDLPSNTTALSYLLGTHARTVDTGDIYYIDSTGTWIQQPSPNQLDLTGYYTSAETDTLLSGKQESLTAAQLAAANSGLTAAVLQSMISGISKNQLSYTLAELQTINTAGTWSANEYTRRGITYTVNPDMTITANGTNDGTGSSWLDLKSSNTIAGLNGVGCPAGGGAATYQIQYGNDRYDNGNGAITNTGSVGIVLRENVTVSDLVFRPMIITTQDLTDNPDYAPFYLSLGQLYQLVKSYHP